MVHLLLQMSQLGVLIFLVSEQLFTFNSHIQQKYVPEDGFVSFALYSETDFVFSGLCSQKWKNSSSFC